MNTQTIILDVTKPSGILQTVTIGQGDANGTTLVANIYDNGTELTLTGYDVKLCIQTPNGAGYYECDGTVSGNAATFAIDETYAGTVAGVSKIAYVEIIDGDTTVCSTNRFTVIVLQNGTEGADPNGAYTNGVERFLEDAQEQLDEAIEGALSTKADADGAYPDLYAGSAGELAGYSEGTSIAYTGSKFVGLTIYGSTEQSGTPTPSAPVPISVVEPANILDRTPYRVGSGFYNPSPGTQIVAQSSDSGITVTDNGTVITLDASTTWKGVVFVSDALEVGKSYRFSHGAMAFTSQTSSFGRSYFTLDADHKVVRNLGNSNTLPTNAGGWTVTLESGEVYFAIGIGVRGTAASFTIDNLWMNKGTTALPYSLYGVIVLNCGGVSTPIDLDGNVLASLPDGTRDELNIDSTGAVTLTKRIGHDAYTDSDTFLKYSNVYSHTTQQTGLSPDNGGSGYCNSYQWQKIGSTSSTTLGGKFDYHNTSVRFCRPDISTKEDFAATLTGNPLDVYYKLATEQTITLDPIEPPDTSGGGTISVTAAVTPTIKVSLGEFGESSDELRDRALSVIAAIENGNASTNYAVGSYLIHKGTLYKVTSAIASGEEIDPGTNVTATTVMAELIALTA